VNAAEQISVSLCLKWLSQALFILSELQGQSLLHCELLEFHCSYELVG